MRLLLLGALLGIVLSVASCFDPEPAEIGVNCKKNGRGQGCAIVLLNDKGVQIQAETTDFNGVGYIRGLPPGSYTVKFLDKQGGFYPAVYEIDLSAGESEFLDVELTQQGNVTETES
jgi:hypothetical protein